ncbi:MAG: helix-turn-helix domain-containing protein [Crocinitomicaceae bacterium]|nr:helix-turn-helix domain-containing protein [Crocinitomicaceae bacterium]
MLTTAYSFDGTEIAQIALSAISRCNQKAGINLIIGVVRGADTMEIHEKKLNQIKTYGAGKAFSFAQWQHYLNQLINQGFIEVAYDEHFYLKLTETSTEVLKGILKVHLSEYAEKEKPGKKSRKTNPQVSAEDQLLQELKLWRKQVAIENQVPAYVIFHDSTLNEIVQRKPQNLAELKEVQGMGQTKLEKFGETLIEIIGTVETPVVKDKRSTFEKTFDLYVQGLSIEKIAEQRSMSVETIYGHLARLYEDGKPVNLNKYVSEYDVNRVKEVRKKLNNSQQLKPIYEALNGEIEYRKIGLALTIISTESNT